MMVFPIHLRQWGFESVQTLLNSSRRRSTASPYRTRYRYSVTKIKFFTDPLWTKYIKTVLRRQAYRFELRPSGQQLRNLRQFAGSCRFVYTNIREEFRSSSEINKNHVFVEDLPVRNMCKSSKGTGKRAVSQCGFHQCGKYPRGVASLSATLACSKCVVAGTTEGIHRLGVEPVGIPGL